MEKNSTRSAKRWIATDVTWMALVIGLYVAVTLVLSVSNFGVIRIRLSKIFNYLSLYNKRYIVTVATGVALANIVSPLGLIDVVVGSISTPIVLLINYKTAGRTKNMKIEVVVTARVFAFPVFAVTGQLTILYRLPFFLNWWVIVLGELASMIVGGIIIYWTSKKVDLTE